MQNEISFQECRVFLYGSYYRDEEGLWLHCVRYGGTLVQIGATNANVNFNAQEGRSIMDVCKQLIILLCMFFRGNMLELLLDLSFPPSLPPFKQSILLSVQV
jgi:hypothetical protein